MARHLRWAVVPAVCLMVALAWAQEAEEPAAQPESTTSPKATVIATSEAMHVLGLENVRRGSKGKLFAGIAALSFENADVQARIPLAEIEDVSLGNDSKRLIGGPIGTLTMFGPYGSGRFLSLFREKTDVVTVQYRDNNGGLHGAIFSLPEGEGLAIKKKLVEMGVKVSVPIAEDEKAAAHEAAKKKPVTEKASEKEKMK